MRSLLTTVLLLGAASVFAADFLSNRVTAHRGNSGDFPENTIPAFHSGIDVESDWIELDILRTKNGQLVVIHDQTTKRVGDQDLVVDEYTFDSKDLSLGGFTNAGDASDRASPSVVNRMFREVYLFGRAANQSSAGSSNLSRSAFAIVGAKRASM